MLNRVGIVGVGLVGGSLAAALRARGLCKEILGFGRSAARLDQARDSGLIDAGTTCIEDLAELDLVVFGVPVLALRALLERFAAAWDGKGLLTDVGSTKGSVVADARQALGGRFARFVPGHPIAGGERSGFEFADSELFVGHKVILTPEPDTDAAALEPVAALWRGVGAEVRFMSVAEHDTTLAATSHLPHLLAYALVGALAGRADADRVFEFAAGGFRDFTRIASSDPDMWADICIANAAELVTVLGDVEQVMGRLRAAVSGGDRAALHELFRQAKAARDRRFGSHP